MYVIGLLIGKGWGHTLLLALVVKLLLHAQLVAMSTGLLTAVGGTRRQSRITSTKRYMTK